MCEKIFEIIDNGNRLCPQQSYSYTQSHCVHNSNKKVCIWKSCQHNGYYIHYDQSEMHFNNVSQRFLDMINATDKFLHQFITFDKKLSHHYSRPEVDQTDGTASHKTIVQTMSESSPNAARIVPSVGKVMASVIILHSI